jgi:hypothetical protein
MPLLNYTTQIQASKTVAEITNILVAHHAQRVTNDYDSEGQIKSLSFEVNTPHGLAEIVLPVDPEAVLKVMRKYGSHVPARLQNKQQAIRVAWRIIKDWIEAQMAILDTEMVKMEQIFLPYIQTEQGQTVFQVFEERKMLTKSNYELLEVPNAE